MGILKLRECPTDLVANRRLIMWRRVLLLKRSDVDVSLKDYEGYTAYDLYNSELWRLRNRRHQEMFLQSCLHGVPIGTS